MNQPTRLLTREFLILNLITFLAFCNIAAFFQFNQYLNLLSLDQDKSGILISLFALTALIIRPLISPIFNAANAKGWLALGLVGVMLSLCLYYPARSFWTLALVRLAHGGFHVVMASASMARIIACIPPDKSSRAFGLMSVIILLPYAVMPLAVDLLMGLLGGFPQVLVALSLLMLPALGLLALVGPAPADSPRERLSWREVKQNLADRRIMLMLLVSLLLYTAFGPVFYFLYSFGLKIGIPNPGLFFTLSTCTEIAVRLAGGSLLDRLPKIPVLAGSLSLLAVGYFLLPQTTGPVMFLALGLLFGLAWGVALPQTNALIFDLSPQRFRALNANLGMETFQGGLFLGPILGGWLLDGLGYTPLYYACGATVILGIFILIILNRLSPADK